MNTVILMGRLTRDPEVRYSSGNNSMAIANYRLAVDRRMKREGQPDADFFDCTVFGRQAEFAEKYLHKGTKMVVQGRLQNDSYQDKEGRNVTRTVIIVENQEFAESKAAASQYSGQSYGRSESDQGQQSYSTPARSEAPKPAADGFMNIPGTMEEDLPFNS